MLLATLCKALVRDGALTLIDADGITYRFGRPTRAADVVVRLHDRSLHRKLALDPFVALGEAYTEGSLTVERGDVHELLDLCVRNLERLRGRAEARWALALTRRFAPPRGDLSEILDDALLDRDRQYSCAYFADPGMSLEEAQEAKKQHLAGKLLLRTGQKVLDVGCGFGGLALHLAEVGGVDVTGITLSTEQVSVARRRAAEAELASQVSFHVRDLRHETGKYDRVVSVGMLEHAGWPRHRELFGRLRDLLTDEGVAVVHSVARMDGPSASVPAWLRARLSPGAYVPALSELLPLIERERLWVTDVEILRLHYAETLRHWRRRFVAGWERVSRLHDEKTCRRWEFYLALREVGFRRGALMVFEIQLARRADAVPLTRDYMYERPPVAGGAVGVAA
jgi:cyclopropane-fatty-acyl-phospholipid synthase